LGLRTFFANQNGLFANQPFFVLISAAQTGSFANAATDVEDVVLMLLPIFVCHLRQSLYVTRHIFTTPFNVLGK
jgi:hypothetical protein